MTRRPLIIAMLLWAGRARAQDSAAYGEMRFRVGAVDNAHAGAISRDWKPLIGKQIEVATPLAVGEVGASVARVHYEPLTGKPAYKATLFTISWLAPEIRVGRAGLAAGFRYSDYRMDFDDPTLVGGLRTEEEVMPGVIARGRVILTRRISLVGDASYGVLMLGHHTRMVLLAAAAQYALPTPAWLRGIMR